MDEDTSKDSKFKVHDRVRFAVDSNLAFAGEWAVIGVGQLHPAPTVVLFSYDIVQGARTLLGIPENKLAEAVPAPDGQ